MNLDSIHASCASVCINLNVRNTDAANKTEEMIHSERAQIEIMDLDFKITDESSWRAI